MNIHYMSDIHLEFGAMQKPLPKGDILLLAGDITICKALEPQMTDPRSRSIKRATRSFFNHAQEQFDRIYAVTGNHEPYGSYYEDQLPTLRTFPATAQARWLDCEAVELDSRTLLFGATLWTDMDRGNPLSHMKVREGMNDFAVVYTRNEWGLWTTQDAAKHHERALYRLDMICKENPDYTIVVMTHHAPSWLGIGPSHHNSEINAGYASNLHRFIEEHPNIRYWVHGHTHIRANYDIAQCKVMANCRGYAHMYESRGFDPDCSFEVQHASV
jgi:hypothetical protein